VELAAVVADKVEEMDLQEHVDRWGFGSATKEAQKLFEHE
jgi:hypothetical protein